MTPQKARRLRLEQEGLCTTCGSNPPRESRKRCESCLARQNIASKDYFARKTSGGPINPVGRPANYNRNDPPGQLIPEGGVIPRNITANEPTKAIYPKPVEEEFDEDFLRQLRNGGITM